MAPQRETTPGFKDDRYRLLVAELRARREALGWSQTALAERLGLHKQFVSRFELGERRLDVVELADVARALALDPRRLVAAIPERGADAPATQTADMARGRSADEG